MHKIKSILVQMVVGMLAGITWSQNPFLLCIHTNWPGYPPQNVPANMDVMDWSNEHSPGTADQIGYFRLLSIGKLEPCSYPWLISRDFAMAMPVNPTQTLTKARTQLQLLFHQSKDTDRVADEHEYYGIVTNLYATYGITNSPHATSPRAVMVALGTNVINESNSVLRLRALASEIRAAAQADEGQRGGNPGAAMKGASFTGDQW